MYERHDSTIELLKDRLKLAIVKLSSVGKIVGYVSRRNQSRVSEEGVKVVVEVDPYTYFNEGLSIGVGDYLVATDLKSLKYVGLRVKSIVRSDAASEIETPLSIGLESGVESLLTYTLIEAEPLLTEDGLPVTTPIEPQSPVAIPTNPELVEVVTGLPTDGVVLGTLISPTALIPDNPVPLKLPKYEFFKHILVVGTTGSGKTTFLKNLIFSLLSSWEDVFITVIDVTGDYSQIVLLPNQLPKDSKVFIGKFEELILKYPKQITCLIPLRRRLYRSLTEVFRDYVYDRFYKVLTTYYGLNVRYELSLDGRDLGIIKSTIASLDLGKFKVDIELIPISLSYVKIRDHLDVLPLFSRQARIYLKNIITFLENEAGGIGNFTMLYMMFSKFKKDLINTMKLHKATLESIERVLNFLASSDDVDVIVDGNYLGIPPIELLVKGFRGPVILDLDYSLTKGSSPFIVNLIAYEYLRSLYAWKKSTLQEGVDRPSIVILDEAHRFFPSIGTSYEEVDMLADFISMVTRLGRAKGLGFIFSTHSPKDVHKIILQLTNTKVIFRSEKTFLELLDIPREYMNYLQLAPDRVGLIRSSVIRSGYALFKTSEPLLGHYDVSRLLIR